MIILVDADSIIWKAGKITEANEDTEHGLHCALGNAKRIVVKILERTLPLDYRIYIGSTDRSNFRYNVDPNYKANRAKGEKPVHFEALRQYLIKSWSAEEVFNEEAEDMVAQQHFKRARLDNIEEHSMVVHIDKDLNQLPGWHYNYDKDIIYKLEDVEAQRFFYKQLLEGDRADNVPRIKPRWLKKEYFNTIDNLQDETSMKQAAVAEVKNLYPELTQDQIYDMLTQRGKLLWLRRYPEQDWEFDDDETFW